MRKITRLLIGAAMTAAVIGPVAAAAAPAASAAPAFTCPTGTGTVCQFSGTDWTGSEQTTTDVNDGYNALTYKGSATDHSGYPVWFYAKSGALAGQYACVDNGDRIDLGGGYGYYSTYNADGNTCAGPTQPIWPPA